MAIVGLVSWNAVGYTKQARLVNWMAIVGLVLVSWNAIGYTTQARNRQ